MDEFKTKEAIAALKDDPLMTHAKWVQWAVACAERTLHLFEGSYPDDARPRQALDAAREWLRAPSTKTATAAADAAHAAHAAYAAAHAANAANAAPAAAYAANAATRAAYAATRAAYAADAKEEQWQVIRLLSIYHGEK